MGFFAVQRPGEFPDRPAAHRRGVTILICCHNAAGRLVPTLRHLLAQQTSGATPWEVLVVDNASSDGTAEVARSVWPAGHTAPLRVISEPRLGLSYARARGLAEARYEYISFVDDDNWVNPQWIETVCAIFDGDPDIGACGSRNAAVFEAPPPPWFDRYKQGYAVGDWGSVARYTSFADIWGAGLSLRRIAWQQLQRVGFSPILTDRKGNELSSCGDTEICAALSLLGWKLWYDPRLRLEHFIPAQRLTWTYLRRLWRGFGRAAVAISWYSYALTERPTTRWNRLRQTWAGNLGICLRLLLPRAKALLAGKEGCHDQIIAEATLHKMEVLLTGFKAYRRGVRRIEHLRLAGLELAAGPLVADIPHVMAENVDVLPSK
jgi:glycosyltransferase involved in cell wall biosynthesis